MGTLADFGVRGNPPRRATIRRHMPDTFRLPTTANLLRRIRDFSGRPVVMVADLVADRFVTGVPKRISREAPVLILTYEGERWTPGGGANAVANVAALGGRPLPLGVVGDDESGSHLLDELESRGVTTEGILTHPGYRTPTKTRILAGARGTIKQQVVRYDVEDRWQPADDEMARLRDVLDAWGGRAAPAVAVLSDYGYGAVEPRWVGLLRAELGSGARLLVDSRHRLAEFGGVDGATPNQEEAEALHGGPLPEEAAGLEAAGHALRRRLGTGFLLVTRGSRGMSLFLEDASVHVPVHGTDQVADVTGAGDTVIGTFALALAAGADPVEATLLADYAGGVVVMKMGTATLGPEELAAAVESDPTPLERLESRLLESTEGS